MANLNKISRYNRQVILPEINEEGQKKLFNAQVTVIGCGGLGASVIPYLVAAGIGRISLYDDDIISPSNLNRQILFKEKDVTQLKVTKTAEWIKEFDSFVDIQVHQKKILPHNILQELGTAHLVLDCVDTMHTKFLINDACMKLGKPFIHCACVAFSGQLLVIPSQESPCLRCLFEAIPPSHELQSCQSAGIVGAACGIIGSMAALEAIKFIVNSQNSTPGRFQSFDFLDTQLKIFNFDKNISCPSCSQSPTIDPTCEADYLS